MEAALVGGPPVGSLTMDIVAQATAELQAAHVTGIIHRDVKSADLLLASDGTIKITQRTLTRHFAIAATEASSRADLKPDKSYFASNRSQ